MSRFYHWLRNEHTEEFTFPGWVWAIALIIVVKFAVESAIVVVGQIWGLL